jgi:hypothetical protein
MLSTEVLELRNPIYTNNETIGKESAIMNDVLLLIHIYTKVVAYFYYLQY